MGDDAQLRAELLRLESALARREPRGVDGGLAPLIPDDFLEFGASGRVWHAASVRESLVTEPPQDAVIEDFAIIRLGDTAVLATYRVASPRPANRSSLWVRRD